MTRRDHSHIFLPYFIFLLISVTLLISDKIKLINFIRSPLEIIFVTPRKTLYLVKTRFKENFSLLLVKDMHEKITRSDDYKRELDVLKARVKLLEEENNSLRKQLEAPLPPKWDFIPALVLGKDRYLLLDQGTQKGVVSGMPVIYQNHLIGKIINTTPRTSKMMFLWDPESKIPVKTEKNSRGLLVGAYGSQIIISRVLQKEPLEVTDIVLTSGEEEYPPNLVVGKVEKVIAKAEDIYDIYKEAIVIPLLDYDNLKNVFILTSY